MLNRFASRTVPVFIGTMFLLPFLWPLHSAPIPSFYGEWISALLLLLAVFFSFWLTPKDKQAFSVPLISLVFIALVGVVLLQLNLGMLTYIYTAVFAMLILVLAAMAAMLGAASTRSLGLDKVLFWISLAAVTGGILSFVAQVMQFYSVDEWFSPWISPHLNNNRSFYYGNLAQPNHLATFLSWSLICTLYLYAKRLLALRYACAIGLIFLTAIALTGSKTSWLQVIWIAIASSFMVWRLPAAERPRYWYLVATLPVCYLVVTLALPYIGKIGSSSSSFELSALERATIATLDVGRRVIYAQAWELFTRNPMLGIGIGQLEFNQFLLLDKHKQTLLSGSAHNIILDFLVFTGLAGTAIFAGFVIPWIGRLRQLRGTFENGTVILLLTVLGGHAMVEFPQWYAYFLLPAAFFMGCLETRSIEVPRTSLFRMAPAVSAIAGLLLCVFFYKEYLRIESISTHFNAKNMRGEERITAREYISLLEMQHSTFFTPQIDQLIAANIPLDGDDLAQKLQISERAMRLNLATPLVFRHIAWLAMAEREDEALVHLERLAKLRPQHLSAITEDIKLLEKSYPGRFTKLGARSDRLLSIALAELKR